MAKAERSGTAWYAIKNLAAALLFGITAMLLGPTAVFVGTLGLIILGVAMIIQGLNYIGETSFWWTVASIVIGVLMIGFSQKLMEFDWLVKLSDVCSAGFVAYVGLRQRKKCYEHYGDGTRFETGLKVLARLVFYPLFLGGIVMAVGAAINFIQLFVNSDVMTKVSGSLLTGGAAACDVGAVCWFVYTILVLCALKESGRTINSFKRNRSSGSSSGSATAQGRSGGAGEAKVRSEMNSIANYFTGGFDYPYSGSSCKITYSVSVSVDGSNISFMLRYELTGTVPQSAASTVRSNAASLIQKRQKLILDKAESRLNAIGPDRDYSLSVNVSEK